MWGIFVVCLIVWDIEDIILVMFVLVDIELCEFVGLNFVYFLDFGIG